MSRAIINEDSLYNIGDAIRDLINDDDLYYPSEMPDKIRSAENGGKSFIINVNEDNGELIFNKDKQDILAAIDGGYSVIAIYDSENNGGSRVFPYVSTYNGILIFSNITCHNVFGGSNVYISGYALFYVISDESVTFYHIDTQFASQTDIDNKIDKFDITANKINTNWQFNKRYVEIKTAINNGKYAYVVATIDGETKIFPYIGRNSSNDLLFGSSIPYVDSNNNTAYILEDLFILKSNNIVSYSNSQINISQSSNNSSTGGVGENVAGKKFNINNIETTAGLFAERFNNYSDNISTGSYAHSEGYKTIAQGSNSHAEGNETLSKGINSHAEGYKNESIGNNAHSEGSLTKSSGMSSHTEGTSTTASGAQAHAEGSNNTASGAQSHAEGFNTLAQGNKSHAEGVGTVAEGENQHVQGKFNIPDVTNKYADIVGNGTDADHRSNASTTTWNGIVWAKNDFVIGGDDETTGLSIYDTIKNPVGKTYEDLHYTYDDQVYIIPRSAEVFNDYENNMAFGEYSDAKGYNTKAVGDMSHAEGNQSKAIGNASHAEGVACISNGYASHAEGIENVANGIGSHVEGLKNESFVPGQHVEGRFAKKDEAGRYISIIGNGTSDSTRSNGFTLDSNGNGWFLGDLYLGGEDDSNPAVKLLELANILNRNPFLTIHKYINTEDNEEDFANNTYDLNWNEKVIFKDEKDSDLTTLQLNILSPPSDDLTSEMIIVVYTNDTLPTITGLDNIIISGDSMATNSRYELKINEELFAVATNYPLTSP